MNDERETNLLDIIVGIFFYSLITFLIDIILNWESYNEIAWFISKTMIGGIIAWCVIGVIFLIAYTWVWLKNYTIISRKKLKELGNTK